MRLSLPLIVSMSLNVVLAGGLLLAARDVVTEAVTADENDPARLFEIAQGAGLSESRSYQLALIAARPPIQAASPAEYWKIEGRREQTVLSQEGDAAVRSRLLKAFGESAKDRPEFASLFKPLASRYPFLSSEKQLALQEILASAGAPGRADAVCPPGGC